MADRVSMRGGSVFMIGSIAVLVILLSYLTFSGGLDRAGEKYRAQTLAPNHLLEGSDPAQSRNDAISKHLRAEMASLKQDMRSSLADLAKEQRNLLQDIKKQQQEWQRRTKFPTPVAPVPVDALTPRPCLNESSEVGKLTELSVQWFAPFHSPSGYGEEAISFVLDLAKFVNLGVYPHGDDPNPHFVVGTLSPVVRESLRVLEYDTVTNMDTSIAVCHSQPASWSGSSVVYSGVYNSCPPDTARYRVGRTMYEASHIPASWVGQANEWMHELWVPSQFDKAAFRRSGVTTDIRVVPESVDCEYFDPTKANPSPYLKGKEDHFKFFSVFKWEERKGWRFILKAYLSEFSNKDKVTLFILTKNAWADPVVAFLDELGVDLNTAPDIHFLPPGLPRHMLRDLYGGIDVLVQSSRGEGWGRPHVESMCMAKPLIATNWTGTTEYLHEGIGYPLAVEKEEPCAPEFDSSPWCTWAKPSVAHLRQLMRHTKTNYEEAKQRGQRARQEMIDKYCPTCVTRLIMKELTRISKRLGVALQKPPPGLQTLAPRVLRGKIRRDGRCGGHYPAPDNRGWGECVNECCSEDNRCGSECCPRCADFHKEAGTHDVEENPSIFLSDLQELILRRRELRGLRAVGLDAGASAYLGKLEQGTATSKKLQLQSQQVSVGKAESSASGNFADLIASTPSVEARAASPSALSSDSTDVLWDSDEDSDDGVV